MNKTAGISPIVQKNTKIKTILDIHKCSNNLLKLQNVCNMKCNNYTILYTQ